MSVPTVVIARISPCTPPPNGDHELPSQTNRLFCRMLIPPANSRTPSVPNAKGKWPKSSPTGVQVWPFHLETPLMVIPFVSRKLLGAYNSLFKTASDHTNSRLPDPSGNQFVPSHRATKFALVPPAWVKKPPA